MINSKSTSPPGNEHGKIVASLPAQLIDFFDARIQIDEQYMQAMLRLNNKLDHIQHNPTPCANVLKCLKAVHSQKIHQIAQFVEQLKFEKDSFKDSVKKFQKEVQKSSAELITAERNLKSLMEKANKLKAKGEADLKEKDEKFILKELGFLGHDFSKKQIQESVKILDEQAGLQQQLKKQYQLIKEEAEKVIKKVKKYDKIIQQQSPNIQHQIIEVVKRTTIHEISLIRNLQYDVDNMIKKTNIFEEKEPEEKQTKFPLHPTAKAAREMFKIDFKIDDPYHNIKDIIAKRTVIEARARPEPQNEEKLKELLQIWKDREELQKICSKVQQNNELRTSLTNFVESFRHKNTTRFHEEQFQKMTNLCKVLLRRSFELRDLQTIHRLIIYGSIYLCEETKQCVMDRIRQEKYLSDIYFWKFMLYEAIWLAVTECSNIQNQRETHVKNHVFSTLISSSLNMVASGIDKYQVRNTVAKMSKSFGLGEAQLQDLLKFIDHGVEKYEKYKK